MDKKRNGPLPLLGMNVSVFPIKEGGALWI